MIAGQSNAQGQGTTLNNYGYFFPAGLFKQTPGGWFHLADPTGMGGGGGSVWPFFGIQYQAAKPIPVGIIQTAVGGTSMSEWLPGQPRYQVMLASVAQAGVPIKAVLWWQGENEAISGVSQASYHAALQTLAAGIAADLGCPLIPTKLQSMLGVPQANTDQINAAIGQAWGDVPNVRRGPDLSDIVSDDIFHLKSDAKIQLAAQRWADAVLAVFP